MTLDFLGLGPGDDDGGPVARSPMAPGARAAGARFEVRGGFEVAVDYGSAPAQEAHEARAAAGWADVSQLGTLELQGPASALEALASRCGASLELGRAVRAGECWWCRLTGGRALIVGDTPALRAALQAAVAADERVTLLDVSTSFAAIALLGPLSREVLARFCALDLRPSVTPVGALRPGSIARQPGIVICEGPDRFLSLFGWATAEYMWSVVADAAEHLGGRPIGADALALLDSRGGVPEEAGVA